MSSCGSSSEQCTHQGPIPRGTCPFSENTGSPRTWPKCKQPGRTREALPTSPVCCGHRCPDGWRICAKSLPKSRSPPSSMICWKCPRHSARQPSYTHGFPHGGGRGRSAQGQGQKSARRESQWCSLLKPWIAHSSSPPRGTIHMRPASRMLPEGSRVFVGAWSRRHGWGLAHGSFLQLPSWLSACRLLGMTAAVRINHEVLEASLHPGLERPEIVNLLILLLSCCPRVLLL